MSQPKISLKIWNDISIGGQPPWAHPWLHPWTWYCINESEWGLRTAGPFLDLTYGAPGLGPINVYRANLGQVGRDLGLKVLVSKYS